jgi:hypothetical protein
MKQSLFALLLLASFSVFAQDFPLTLVGGPGTKVNLSLDGDWLTVGMTYQASPGNSARYRLNICDINFVGGDVASYDYSYSKYYFLKVSFALKKGGRFEVLQQPSSPYDRDAPYSYTNEADGNHVAAYTNCVEFDDQWKEVNDASCKTIYVVAQAFGDNVHELYNWRQRILNRVSQCGSGKIVYRKYSFSCRDEQMVAGNNPSFRPHTGDCAGEPPSADGFNSYAERNQWIYGILQRGNSFSSQQQAQNAGNRTPASTPVYTDPYAINIQYTGNIDQYMAEVKATYYKTEELKNIDLSRAIVNWKKLLEVNESFGSMFRTRYPNEEEKALNVIARYTQSRSSGDYDKALAEA